jgi:hypothetical protein
VGYMRHHTIVVTSWDDKAVERAHAEALRLFGEFAPDYGKPSNLVSPIVGPAINDYRTFLIAPDGSKEGWDASDSGDALRAEFINWLWLQAYEDGSSRLDWALVQFGDEERDQRVLLASDLKED